MTPKFKNIILPLTILYQPQTHYQLIKREREKSHYQVNSDPKKKAIEIGHKIFTEIPSNQSKRGHSTENVCALLIYNEAQHSLEEASVSWL